MQHIKNKNKMKNKMEKIFTNKEILIYPECALKLTNLTYKVAIDNCSISINK